MATIEELREQVRFTDFTPEQQIRITEIVQAVEHDADYAASEIVKLEAERDSALLKLGRVESENAALHESLRTLGQLYNEQGLKLATAECRLDAARRLLDQLETWEHPDDPGKSIIDSKGYHLIEEVGVILGDDGPEAAARATARFVERQCPNCNSPITSYVERRRDNG